MTVKDLKRRFESIPNIGAINKARRAEIIAMINRAESGENV